MRSDRYGEQLSAVAVGAGCDEIRQLGHRDCRGRGSQCGGGRSPARTQDDGDVVAADPRAFGYYRSRPPGVWTHSVPA